MGSFALRLVPLAVVAMVATLASGDGRAAACAVGTSPFSDVPDAANYCTNTEWMKNRAITTGCGAGTTYCPTDFVTRASMALFMNRLGTALTPALVHAETTFGSGGTNFRACETAPFVIPANGFPRTAHVMASVSFFNNEAASTKSDWQTFIIATTTNWATTLFLNPGGANNFTVSGTNTGTSSINSTPLSLNPGNTYQFAVVLNRINGIGVNGAGTCHLTVRIDNRDGTSSPFDEALLPRATGAPPPAPPGV
jgi:hypothetical protein